MQHVFSEVPKAQIPRSVFDRSSGYKTTFNAAYLVPFFVDEAVPGDTFKCKVHGICRMATPIYPIMDNLYLDYMFFAVPNRLIQTNWVKLMGEKDNPADTIDYLVPTMTTASGYGELSLSDYFGIPTKVAGLTHSSLWHRAYNLIWNEWFRDQNLQDSVVVDKDDGPDDEADYVLLKRGKRHDYFTSALPFLQKGDSVDLPLGTVAPILGIGKGNTNWQTGPQTVYETGQSGSTSFAKFADINYAAADSKWYVEEDSGNTGYPGIYADLSNATAATINQLREAWQVQRLLERDARSGTRYVESIKAHFGVTSPDFRLQRPEYLGGASTMIQVSPVAQQSSSDVTSPQGNLAAYAYGLMTGKGFTKSFTEHCVIIGLVNVRSDITYQQGLNRMFSRSTRYDFYYPAFAHLGEQAILNKEIYAQGTAGAGADDQAFGYQERWAEMRYKPSQVTGQFRSNCTTPLDAWHLALDFSALPVLNDSFIQDSPPITRVIATPTEPQFILDTYIDLKCARPMPLYSVPGNTDRF